MFVKKTLILTDLHACVMKTTSTMTDNVNFVIQNKI